MQVADSVLMGKRIKNKTANIIMSLYKSSAVIFGILGIVVFTSSQKVICGTGKSSEESNKK